MGRKKKGAKKAKKTMGNNRSSAMADDLLSALEGLSLSMEDIDLDDVSKTESEPKKSHASSAELLTALENLASDKSDDNSARTIDRHGLFGDCPLCAGPVVPFWDLKGKVEKERGAVERTWFLCCGRFCCAACARPMTKRIGKAIKKGKPNASPAQCPFCEIPILDGQGYYTREMKLALQDAAMKEKKPWALFCLGMIHRGKAHTFHPDDSFFKGTEQQRNPASSTELIHRSAEQGYPMALAQLAADYKKGRWVPQSTRISNQLYHFALEQGHARSGLILWKQYESRGETRKGIECLKLVSKYGCSIASCFVALCYQDGLLGVEKDLNTSFQYWERGANQGHKVAQLRAGVLLYTSKNLNLGTAKAVEYLTMSANQGHAEAQCRLGACLITRYPLQSKEWVEGIHWLRSGCGLGYEGCEEPAALLKSTEESIKTYCFYCAAKSHTTKDMDKSGGLCSKCKAVHYCSRECQSADWENGHRRNCKKSP